LAPATPQTFALSLHYALPIYEERELMEDQIRAGIDAIAGYIDTIENDEEITLEAAEATNKEAAAQLALNEIEDRPRYLKALTKRSEEHTSELQSRENLVCRLL